MNKKEFEENREKAKELNKHINNLKKMIAECEDKAYAEVLGEEYVALRKELKELEDHCWI